MGKRPKTGSRIAKHSIIFSSGRKTSVSLERPFWDALKAIAATENVNLYELISKIDSQRQHANLSSVIRLYVLAYYREAADNKA